MQKSNYFANIFMFISKISVWRSQLNAATTIGDAGIKNGIYIQSCTKIFCYQRGSDPAPLFSL